jgi:hypothetical protein
MALDVHSLDELSAERLFQRLQKIDPNTLSEERIRAAQGSAGVTDLYQAMKSQVFA